MERREEEEIGATGWDKGVDGGNIAVLLERRNASGDVGAGVVGCDCAFWLARKKANNLDIVIITAGIAIYKMRKIKKKVVKKQGGGGGNSELV